MSMSGPPPRYDQEAPSNGRPPSAPARAPRGRSSKPSGTRRKSGPKRSYLRRVSGSESTWYASLISLNRSSASACLLTSGW
jgi:hypothetical protein